MRRNVYEEFRHRATEHGSRPFLKTAEEMIDYGTVAEWARGYSESFPASRRDEDQVIGLLLDNRPEFVYALLGALRAGNTVACLNTGMRGEGLGHLLERAGITTVLSSDEHLSDVAETCRGVGVQTLYSVTPDTKYESFQAERRSPSSSNEPPREPTDPAVLLHTSGTTGLPKWCELSHSYLLRLGDYVADRFEIAPTDTVFNPLPLYHVNPLGYYFFGGLSAGATLGMVSSFSVSQFWDQVRTLDATVVVLHMAPKDMIAERTTPEDAEGHEIRVMFPADRVWLRRFDVPKMVTGYGSTEAGGLTHTNKFTHVPPELDDGEKLSQYAGYPRRDVSVRIVDENGREVSQSQQGEILVRPEEPGVIFDGYYGDSKKTVEAWDGLWFNTGDLGYVDERGALHFVGRLSNAISHKGQFVNVSLVESTLESAEGIDEAVVVGVPDDVVGERVKAYVRSKEALDPNALVDTVSPELPTYMVPEFIEFVQSFPRIEGTEKIDRAALVERGVGDAWRRE